MLASITDGIYLFFRPSDRRPQLVAFFSVRLDEAGMDGLSKYAVVAGAVASFPQWKQAESRWENLLRRSKVSAYHDCEFQDKSGDFFGWEKLKAQRFVAAQEKIIRLHTGFEVAVAVDRRDHSRIKRELHGVKGFKTDSDYGLALRIVMFQVCKLLASRVREPLVQIVVEDGPWSADAYKVYQIVKGTEGSWKPSPHAHMLHGFNALPKGVLRGLEMADYIAGRAIRDLEGSERAPKREKQTFVLANSAFLTKWHESVLKNKEHRRAHAKKLITKLSSDE